MTNEESTDKEREVARSFTAETVTVPAHGLELAPLDGRPAKACSVGGLLMKARFPGPPAAPVQPQTALPVAQAWS